MLIKWFGVLCCLLQLSLNAQVKFEREFRLNTHEVEPQARAYVELFPFTRRIKWYREESSSGASIEAKTSYKGQRFSLEFDTTGVLQDVEVEVKFSALRQDVRAAVESRFNADFKRWKVRKVQRQFSGSPDAVRRSSLEGASAEGANVHYEIVVRGLKDLTELFEYTFDQSGTLISAKLIVLAPTDNLEY
jgi:hypothetical protein